ncbi:Sec-independent protein translocase family protein [Rickettsia endosymbiont of Cardiosporidium cionae]|uniref:hypothetical protein n=1 Tax=Rickettsia endosymbiont of Cardiosporidium cionae TaxID=2777155 RepID=UPI00189607EE|nr:hypothetical protein [Rickettsia endosymbiont of Cardiosporidium cionae]KAF8818601.1 hypothetical protein IHI24_000320 [Rickettsia endosymbiont of Cardiosporidium cionae]
MSFVELLIVILVAILVIKPRDLVCIVKKVKVLLKMVNDFKATVLKSLGNFGMDEINDTEKMSEIDEINDLLAKIVDIQKKEYTGDYSLESLREYYLYLTKKKM